MKDLLFFDAMLTPKIITLIYWLGLISVVVGAVATLFAGALFQALGILVFGLIGTRVWCELLIVLFKIHENLQKIANKA